MAKNRDLNEIIQGDHLLVRCAWCERIKVGDEWVDAEVQAMRHSHGICPDCFAKLAPPDRP